MKLNISFPATGCQKLIEVDNGCKLRTFYEKRMATEVLADSLGEEWKGYVVGISGGNDKGFSVKVSCLTDVSAFCSARAIPAIAPEELER